METARQVARRLTYAWLIATPLLVLVPFVADLG